MKSIKDANGKPFLSIDEVTKHLMEYCEQLFRKEPLEEENFKKNLRVSPLKKMKQTIPFYCRRLKHYQEVEARKKSWL